MNRNMLNISYWKDTSYVLGIFAVILLIFTRNIAAFFKLFIACIIVIYIPGYALATLLLPKWRTLEKSIIALFIGIGPGAVTAYIIGVFGIKTVTVLFSIIIALISILVMLFVKDDKTDSEEKE
jgi:uncharacterized membrane protein